MYGKDTIRSPFKAPPEPAKGLHAITSRKPIGYRSCSQHGHAREALFRNLPTCQEYESRRSIAFLNEVLKIDSDRADIRRKAAAVPFRLGSGNKKKRRSGPSMVGHRKGKVGPGRYPVKGSRAIIKLIQSAMENARHQYEDVDPEEMEITHIAAHRGQIRKGFIPRARGRATPSNHYQVNLEIFLEDFSVQEDELEDDF